MKDCCITYQIKKCVYIVKKCVCVYICVCFGGGGGGWGGGCLDKYICVATWPPPNKNS